MKQVDHLVYGVLDLDDGISHIEKLLGVRPKLGGSHIGLGTRNALLSLGDNTYLEVLAPDPNQPIPIFGRWMHIDELVAPKLIAWASPCRDLRKKHDTAVEHGIEIGELVAMSRTRPSGEVLSWEMSSPNLKFGDGIIPFWLNWLDTPHPSLTLPSGGELVQLEATHKNAPKISGQLRNLGIDLKVVQSDTNSLIATIQTPNGIVQLT